MPSEIKDAMVRIDNELRGALQGAPFTVDPDAVFWSIHEKTSWSEVLRMSPEEFNEDWSSLGTMRDLESIGIFKVNGQDGQPRYPFGKRSTSSTPINWYTFGKRIDPGSSVKDWHDEDSDESAWDEGLLLWVTGCESQSPRKLEPRRRAAAAVPPPVQEASSGAGAAQMDTDVARTAQMDTDARVPATLPATLKEACAAAATTGVPSEREKRLWEVNGESFHVQIDARELSAPLTQAEEFALYALAKRQIEANRRGPGDQAIVIPAKITCSSRPLILRHDTQREKEDLGATQRRAHTAQVAVSLENAGMGSVAGGLALVGRSKKAEFEDAAGKIGVKIFKRMGAVAGLELMAEMNITWAQYRVLNSKLIDELGGPVVAVENLMRANIKNSDPLDMECGAVELLNKKDEGNKVACSRVTSLFGAYEKEYSELINNDLLRDDLEGEGSPFKNKNIINLMGDKGGNSTKFGFVLVNAKSANSAKRFVLLCEFEEVDSYENLEKMVFNYYREEMDALKSSVMLVVKSGAKHAVKMIPREGAMVPPGSSLAAASISEPSPPSTPTPTPIRNQTSSNNSSNNSRNNNNNNLRILDVTGLELPAPASAHEIQIGEDDCGAWALLFQKKQDGNREFVGVGYYDSDYLSCEHFFKFRVPLPVEDDILITARWNLPFLAGDYAFLCEILGHQGASAKRPCLWCLACDKGDVSLQKHSWHDLQQQFPTDCASRSISSMVADYQKYLTTKKKAVDAQNCNNITQMPLLSPSAWDMVQICPMILHLFLGPAAKGWDLLESDARIIDGCSAEVVEELSRRQTVGDFISGLKGDLEQQKKELKTSKSIADRFEDNARLLLETTNGTTLKLNVKKTNAVAAGVTESNWDKAQKMRKEKIATDKEIKDARASIAEVEAEVEKYAEEHAALLEGTHAPGPIEQALEQHLQDINIQRQAYYSGAFVGNHVRLLLNKLGELWKAMRDAADRVGVEARSKVR